MSDKDRVAGRTGTIPGMSFDLAQVNVSRLFAPLESPQLAPFMAALDEVNAEGDAALGFLWRLQTEDGNATAVKAFGWDVAGSHGVIVNLQLRGNGPSADSFTLPKPYPVPGQAAADVHSSDDWLCPA